MQPSHLPVPPLVCRGYDRAAVLSKTRALGPGADVRSWGQPCGQCLTRPGWAQEGPKQTQACLGWAALASGRGESPLCEADATHPVRPSQARFLCAPYCLPTPLSTCAQCPGSSFVAFLGAPRYGYPLFCPTWHPNWTCEWQSGEGVAYETCASGSRGQLEGAISHNRGPRDLIIL